MKWLWRILSTDLCHDRCACMAGQNKLIKKNYLWVLREIAREFPGSPSGVVVCVCVPFPSFSLSLYFSFPFSLFLRRIHHHWTRFVIELKRYTRSIEVFAAGRV